MAIDNAKEFINRQNWIFAKTMAKIPHEHIVRDKLSDEDKEMFDKFSNYIKEKGYPEEFYSKIYQYFDIANYKYWVVDNVLNRAKIKK